MRLALRPSATWVRGATLPCTPPRGAKWAAAGSCPRRESVKAPAPRDWQLARARAGAPGGLLVRNRLGSDRANAGRASRANFLRWTALASRGGVERAHAAGCPFSKPRARGAVASPDTALRLVSRTAGRKDTHEVAIGPAEICLRPRPREYQNQQLLTSRR